MRRNLPSFGVTPPGRFPPFRILLFRSSPERERDLDRDLDRAPGLLERPFVDRPCPPTERSRLVDRPRAMLRLGLFERPLVRDGLELLPPDGVCASKFCDLGFAKPLRWVVMWLL